MTRRWSRDKAGLILKSVVALVLLAGLYYTQTHSYLLFHSLVEIFSVSVAAALFMLAWNSRHFTEAHFLLWIGIGYLFVGMLDLVHTLAYRGMGVLGDVGTDPATQLWVAARYMQALVLLTAPLFFERKLRGRAALAGFAAFTALVLLAIFAWDVFPTAYDDATGTLTPFKIVSEYVISALLLGSVALILARRDHLDRQLLTLLVGSILATLVAEIAFTLYVDPFGPANLIGHFLKLLAFYMLYKAVVEAGLRRPHDVLFRDLKQQEEELEALNETLEERVRERTAQARVLARQLAQAEARERERLATILHDDLQQTLAAARMRVQMAAGRPEATDEALEIADEQLREAIEASRCLAVEVSPAVVRRQGLDDALQWLGDHMRERHRLAVDVRTTGDVALGDADIEALVFRSVRELLFNVVKHAGVDRATVCAEMTDEGELCVTVSDEGRGFEPDEVLRGTPDGFGLGSVRNRVQMLGGRCVISSRPGEGTDVAMTIPPAAS
ncbi:MAG: hypothetical protein GF393_12695 [Armatimonadia bacterium]|nr:hypothetical protein [Armatimonadia bacterium]